MHKKFIVFDIDGTLLTTEMKFLDSTKQALVSLKEKGHYICIATGRDYASAKSIVDELEIETYVLCNGSLGYVRHELAHEVMLSKESIMKLIEIAAENNDQIVFQTVNGIKRHFEEPGESLIKAYESLGWSILTMMDCIGNETQLFKLCFSASKKIFKNTRSKNSDM